MMWRRAGLLTAHRYDDKGQYLYERPGGDAPIKFRHMGKPSENPKHPNQTPSQRTDEEHSDA